MLFVVNKLGKQMAEKKSVKKRIFEIIQIGSKNDVASVLFDMVIVIAIFLNLISMLLLTFDELESYAAVLQMIEMITIILFTVEYFLRVWTAEYLYPEKTKIMAVLSFVVSIYGLIDFFTIFPYYLSASLPMGIAAFRFFRVIRIFRLFRINAQYDAFNVIIEVINEKKEQIISSVCLILIFTVASSLCMYNVEHEAQPEVFKNAFSGIWWSVSTLLTVGYGDIYPVTMFGRVLAIIISFLGVGMVAIPTGIISAGFVEKYTAVRNEIRHGIIREVGFITANIKHGHSWCNQRLCDIVLPPGSLAVLIKRGSQNIVPNVKTVIHEDDVMVLASSSEKDIPKLDEVKLGKDHPWNDTAVKDIDISRKQMVVAVGRDGKNIIPSGETVLRQGDAVLIYSK